MSKTPDINTVSVSFAPMDITVSGELGATILDAARKAGIIVESLCGGDGVCGKCRVIARRGLVEGGTANFLSREEIREGYVLACEARVQSDLLVEVPQVSQMRPRPREVDIAEQRLSEDMALQRQPAKLNPLVHKYGLELSKPTLENNGADLDRLVHALGKINGTGEYQMGLKATRSLASAVRSANGHVTATTAYRGPLTEITDVVAGDSSKVNFAVAIDVGTTSVVAHLVDLTTGQTLGASAKYNGQAVYGADVIRRIMYCSEQPDGLMQLHAIIIDDINTLIQELRERFRLAPKCISLAVIAANTTMVHTILGLDPSYIRREPYVGVAYQPPPFRAAELGISIDPRGLLYCLPCVSSFVGGDITAGILAAGMHESDEPRMLIDIGTNGEIAIGNKDWMVCASASAGPAFEGTGTRDGMRAMRGAIDHVRGWYGGDTLSFSTIGDAAPNGICGTGYIDLLSHLLRVGVIDKMGRLNMSCGSDRMRVNADGTPEFVVVRAGEKGAHRDLAVSQDDVANLTRTKAAVYAASKVLLNSLGLSRSDIKEILVAGAFGYHLDLENAVAIGLLPDIPGESLRFVGNTSVAGAKLVALSRERYQESQDISRAITYFELSTSPIFMEEFTSACFFPHTHIEEFPSVKIEAVGGR